MKEPNAMSFHVKYKPEDFMPANEEEKQSQVIMRESVGFWQDGFRRLRKNKVAMVSLFVIIVVMIFSFIVPAFYPYDYKTQIKGSENLHPMQYSEKEIERMDAGERVFPHVLGTDKMGRDYAIRVMMGSRISLLVGLIATAIIFVIGSLIGSISAFFGGWVDLIIMRIVDIISTIPLTLYVILIMQVLGAGIQSIIVALGSVYWVDMARVVRGQILSLKQQEFVLAAKTIGSSATTILFDHLIPNALGSILVTITMLIPSAIFMEAFLGYLGIGLQPPLASLGTMCNDASANLRTSPHELLIPALMICVITVFPGIAVMLAILSLNLMGDGLRDALDPKLKK